MTAAEHTPTPWVIIPRDETPGFREPVMVNTGAGLWEPRGDRNAEANADFIVRAVNSHDDLLETLRWVRANYAGGSTKEINERIDAALTKAGG